MKRLLVFIGLLCSVGMVAEIHLPDSVWTLYGGFNLYSTNTLTSGPRNYSFLGLGVTWLIWHP